MNAPSVHCPGPRLFVAAPAPAAATRRRSHGLTLLELLLAVAVLAGIAVPNYSQYKERGRAAQAMADMRTIELTLFRVYTEQNGHFPASPADIGVTQRDPWGRPYQYLTAAHSRDDIVRGRNGQFVGKAVDF